MRCQRGKRCGRYLVQQRLEEVVVVLVDKGHAGASIAEPLGDIEAAKAATDDNDMRPRRHSPHAM